MICVDEAAILAKARTMPPGYLEDCAQKATILNANKLWCFKSEDFFALRRFYAKYTVSNVDKFIPDEPISGCCDRADQY